MPIGLLLVCVPRDHSTGTLVFVDGQFLEFSPLIYIPNEVTIVVLPFLFIGITFRHISVKYSITFDL